MLGKFFYGVLGYSVVAIVLSIILYIPLLRDIDGLVAYMDGVVVSKQTMIETSTELKTNMEKYGMTSGYGAVIFKSPDYSYERYYNSIKEIITELQNMDETDLRYSIKIGYIREVISGIGSMGWCYAWTHWGFYLFWIGFFLWIFLVNWAIREYGI